MATANMANQDDNRISQSNKRALRNPWVLGWMGLLIFVVLVNVTMITTAVLTNPGLVEENYYEKGRDHERNFLKNQAARTALGWSYKLDMPEQIIYGQDTVLRFSAVDKLGVALNDATVTLTAYRPSDISADFNTVMEAFAPGQYQAKVNFMLKGIWELKIKINYDDNSYDLMEQRINVQPQ